MEEICQSKAQEVHEVHEYDGYSGCYDYPGDNTMKPYYELNAEAEKKREMIGKIEEEKEAREEATEVKEEEPEPEEEKEPEPEEKEPEPEEEKEPEIDLQEIQRMVEATKQVARETTTYNTLKSCCDLSFLNLEGDLKQKYEKEMKELKEKIAREKFRKEFVLENVEDYS